MLSWEPQLFPSDTGIKFIVQNARCLSRLWAFTHCSSQHLASIDTLPHTIPNPLDMYVCASLSAHACVYAHTRTHTHTLF